MALAKAPDRLVAETIWYNNDLDYRTGHPGGWHRKQAYAKVVANPAATYIAREVLAEAPGRIQPYSKADLEHIVGLAEREFISLRSVGIRVPRIDWFVHRTSLRAPLQLLAQVAIIEGVPLDRELPDSPLSLECEERLMRYYETTAGGDARIQYLNAGQCVLGYPRGDQDVTARNADFYLVDIEPDLG